MPPSKRLRREAFAEAVGTLGPEDLAEFVEALHHARSRDIERQETLQVRPIGASAGASEHADIGPDGIVVVRHESWPNDATAPGESDVLAVDDLYELLLYGIDRGEAEELCREHLGRGIEAEGDRPSVALAPSCRRALGGAPAQVSDGADTKAINHRGGRLRALVRLHRGLLLVLVGLLVIVAAVAGVTGDLPGTPSLGAESGRAVVDDDSPRPTTELAAAAGVTATAADRTRSPSGLRTEGSPAAEERRYVDLTSTCERPPGLVAVAVVGALRNNDPTTDAGIRAAWNFSASDGIGRTYSGFARHVRRDRFAPLFNHPSAGFTPEYRRPGIVAYRVTVTGMDGGQHEYLLALSNQAVDTQRGSVSNRPSSQKEGCWKLEGLLAL